VGGEGVGGTGVGGEGVGGEGAAGALVGTIVVATMSSVSVGAGDGLGVVGTVMVIVGSIVGTVGTVTLELKPDPEPKLAQGLASAVLPQMHLEACKERIKVRSTIIAI
jgi:hypothetical protein